MSATLSDKIRNAPEGSRLRALFVDSSDDESHGVKSPEGTHSQKTQTTCVGTQPPSGIQTQPEHYVIPRKSEKALALFVNEPSPIPKPKQIIISETPNKVDIQSPVDPNVTQEEMASAGKNEIQIHEWHCSSNDSPDMSRIKEPVRISLSPTASSRSRINVHNVSSLEALVPLSDLRSTEPQNKLSRLKKRKMDLSDMDTEPHTSLRRSSPPHERHKDNMNAIEPNLDSTNALHNSVSSRKSSEAKNANAHFESNVNDNAAERKRKKAKADIEANRRSPRALRNESMEAVDSNHENRRPARQRNSKKLSNTNDVHAAEIKPVNNQVTAHVLDQAMLSSEVASECAPEASSARAMDYSFDAVSRTTAASASVVVPECNDLDQKEVNAELEEPMEETKPRRKSYESDNTDNVNEKASSLLKARKKRTFQDQVLAEMLFSCKAYSLKSLAQALSTTEVALQYLMLSLIDKNIVVKKEFTSKSGKTKEIYWANQESKAKDVMKLMTQDSEIEEAKRELDSLQRIDAEIAKEMAILTQDLTNEEIHAQVETTESKVKETDALLTDLRNRIKSQREGKIPVGSGGRLFGRTTAAQMAKETCPRRLALRINALRDEWKSRKQKCMDFVEQLADGMERKPKDIIKLLEVETDEMEGVSIPPKRVFEAISRIKK